MSKRLRKTGAVELAHFLRIYAGISFWLSDFFEFKNVFLYQHHQFWFLWMKNYYLYSFYFCISRILGWNWNLLIALSIGSEEGIFFWIAYLFFVTPTELTKQLKEEWNSFVASLPPLKILSFSNKTASLLISLPFALNNGFTTFLIFLLSTKNDKFKFSKTFFSFFSV